MSSDIGWRNIDTVILDMDGTLLDLAFDRDFWLNCVPAALSRQLDLDIAAMTAGLGHTLRLREDTLPFLAALRRHGRRTILLTNAHPQGLAVKLTHTGLGPHLDLLLSTHTFGYPKEDQRLWRQVRAQTGFDPARTLFIDDSEPILDAASTFGIHYCLGVSNPDSGLAAQGFRQHQALDDYPMLLPALAAAAA